MNKLTRRKFLRNSPSTTAASLLRHTSSKAQTRAELNEAGPRKQAGSVVATTFG